MSRILPRWARRGRRQEAQSVTAPERAQEFSEFGAAEDEGGAEDESGDGR